MVMLAITCFATPSMVNAQNITNGVTTSNSSSTVTSTRPVDVNNGGTNSQNGTSATNGTNTTVQSGPLLGVKLPSAEDIFGKMGLPGSGGNISNALPNIFGGSSKASGGSSGGSAPIIINSQGISRQKKVKLGSDPLSGTDINAIIPQYSDGQLTNAGCARPVWDDMWADYLNKNYGYVNSAAQGQIGDFANNTPPAPVDCFASIMAALEHLRSTYDALSKLLNGQYIFDIDKIVETVKQKVMQMACTYINEQIGASGLYSGFNQILGDVNGYIGAVNDLGATITRETGGGVTMDTSGNNSSGSGSSSNSSTTNTTTTTTNTSSSSSSSSGATNNNSYSRGDNSKYSQTNTPPYNSGGR